MGGKGLYKAMGELDMLFNYIEDYVASQRHKRWMNGDKDTLDKPTGPLFE